MRVVLVAPAWPRSFLPNGVIPAVEQLVEPLRGQGVMTEVLAWMGQVQPGERGIRIIPAAESRNPLRRIGEKARWALDPGGTWRRLAARRIRVALQDSHDDLAECVLEAEEAHGLVADLTGEPGPAVILTLHGPWFIHGRLEGLEVSQREHRARLRAEGAAMRLADFVIAPSRDVLRRARRFYQLDLRDSAVIPYAIRMPMAQERWDLDLCCRSMILFVGRFDRHKGGDTVIDAFARIIESRPETRLTFAGPDRGLTTPDGRSWSLQEYVDAKLPGAVAAGRVVLTGQVTPNVVERLRRKALVVVSASRWENLSLAVLEAMASGCPVVASDSGGVPEHVIPGRTGLLFRSGDPASLASTLLQLLDQPEAAAALGRRAALHVQTELDPDRVAALRMTAYRKALARRRARLTA